MPVERSEREHRRAFENTVKRRVDHERAMGKTTSEQTIRKEVAGLCRVQDTKRENGAFKKGGKR